jgi:hypothetical protein
MRALREMPPSPEMVRPVPGGRGQKEAPRAASGRGQQSCRDVKTQLHNYNYNN